MFQGIKLDKDNFTTEDMRKNHASSVKSRMTSLKNKWGSNQYLNWIESNINSGKSETYNMQEVLERDTKLKY